MNREILYRYEFSNSGKLMKTEFSVCNVTASSIRIQQNESIIDISSKHLDKCKDGIVYSYKNDDMHAVRLLEEYHINQCEISMNIHKKHLNILLNYYQSNN